MRTLAVVEPTPSPAFLDRLLGMWDEGLAVAAVAPGLPPAARDRLLAALRPGVPVDDDVALVLATSGSTGTPKAVELTRAALDASTGASLGRLGGRPGDRWLCCLPVHHIAGLQVLLRAAALGTPGIVHPRFEVALVAAERQATHVSLVPTMLHRLLDAGVDLTGFRAILLGGAAAPPGLLARAAAAGARVVATYGMTETCGGCVYDGLPLDGVDVDVDQDGTIRLRGPVLFRGYRGGPRHAGWFTTSDLGRLDGDGRLQVLGRRDDVINTGGEKVVASEVAALLAAHPDVADVEVIGRPDRDWGQRVVAVVVPRDVAAPPTLTELRAFVAARASAHTAPRELVVVPALPRLPTGKVDCAALRSVPLSARDT